MYSMVQHKYFSATIPYAGNAWGSGDLCNKESSIFSDTLCHVVSISVASISQNGTRHRSAAILFSIVMVHVWYSLADRGTVISKLSEEVALEHFCTTIVV